MKRILFVDDEAPVLEGLRTRLRRLQDKWDMTFLENSALVAEWMEKQPCDVIVCDICMPRIDGVELLEMVSRKWPETIRIVLSGYAEQQQSVRVLSFAHQYLSKPCQPLQLENVIDRCLFLHDLLKQPSLRSLVGRIRSLPSPPEIYSKLQKIVKDESVTLADVAKLVSADAALAARVLQIVNSAFFRLARRITSLEEAVNYLGFQAIRNLAMAVEIFARWPGKVCGELDLEKLQQHVQAVAAAANSLTKRTPIADDSMLAGLLHDIGYWVLAQECPNELAQAVQLAATQKMPLHAAETAIMGASHAEIGAYLLGLWGLPFPVVEAVAHHHQPGRVVQHEFDVLSALVIGHSLAPTDDTFAVGTEVPADPKIEPQYLIDVKAPFTWEEAAQRVAAATSQEEVAI
jgi:HD-like signal output (HDOD) protein